MQKSTKIPFKPLGNNLILKKIHLEERKTSGGIIIASEKDRNVQHANMGVIVSIGDTAFANSGCEVEEKPEVGDVVHYTRYEDEYLSHSKLWIEDENYVIIYDVNVRLIETGE